MSTADLQEKLAETKAQLAEQRLNPCGNSPGKSDGDPQNTQNGCSSCN